MLIVIALGFLAGLRTATPLAAVAWAAHLGRLHLEGTWMSWLASPITAWVFTLLALVEIANDKAPWTPSRKAPPAFIARCISGAFAALAVAGPTHWPLALLGIGGAVAGTLLGAAARARLAAALGRDLPAALIEDVFTVGAAAAIVAFGLR